MRLINISQLKTGEKLSYAIKTQEGRVLLQADTVLTSKFIERLDGFGIRYVYINDDNFDEVKGIPCLKDETKTAALGAVSDALKVIGTKKMINTSQIKNATKQIVADIKTAIVGEPIGLLNMYAVSDPRCLHAVNVATIVCALALEQGCNMGVIEDYTTAALLHDIHLAGMHEDVNVNHAETTKEYLKFTREYSVRTYMSVAMHHEKYDGTGKDKLQGDKIAEGARMIAIADTYDNLLYGYGNNKIMEMNYAVEQLNLYSGKLLDPELLKIFNSSVAVYPSGVTVKLNNGFKAVVVGQNNKMPTRPKVKMIMPDKADCIEINLLTNLTVFVERIENAL